MTKREKEKKTEVLAFIRWLARYGYIHTFLTKGRCGDKYMKFKQSQKKKGSKR